MKNTIVIIAVLLIAAVAVAQENASANGKNSILQQAAQQMLLFQSYSVEEFAKYLKDNEDVVIVDVRTAKEYAEGHLKGAVNVEWGKNFDQALEKSGLDTSKRLAIYCRSGRRSKQAAQKLLEKGFSIVELKDGIVAWQKAKMPVVK